MPYPVFRTEIPTFDRHPVVVEEFALTIATVTNEADIISDRPSPSFVDEIRILLLLLDRMLERDVPALDLAKPDHVRLTQQNEHLHRLRHICRLAVRSRNL